METGLKVLHMGMDGLDVAFQGALSPLSLLTLADAKERAQAEGEDQLVTLGRFKGYVGRTGTSGGYAYRIDTGFDGEIWFIKKSDDPSQWNIRVSVKSLPLATLGYSKVKQRLLRRLSDMGAKVLSESISRVDVAVDFLAPGLEIDPAQFVAHWKSRRPARETGALRPAEIGGDDMVVHWSGRRPSSVTIGTMPNRQVILYDKRREAIDTKKAHWFDIWAKEARADDESVEQAAERLRANKALRVWRLELRAGKAHLDDYRLKTFDDLEGMLGDVVRVTLENVRYLAPESRDSNVTRRAVHPIWPMAREAFLDLMALSEEQVRPSRARAVRRNAVRQESSAMICGVAAVMGHAAGLSREEAVARLPAMIAAEISAHIMLRPEKFLASWRRAERRLYFITEGTDNGRIGTAQAPM